MLKVSSQQMKSLAEVPRHIYARELVEHLRVFAPRLFELRGEAAILAVAEAGIDTAIEHGFTLRGPVRLWVELMFCHGHRFHTDPALPCAHSLRESAALHENERARLLFEVMQAHAAAADGKDKAQLIGSLATLANGDWDATMANPRVHAQPAAALARVFPQRCTRIKPTAMKALLDQARQACETHALEPPGAPFLLAGLFIGFGHGVIDDPLYPWVGSTLTAPQVDGERRTTALALKAKAYVQAVHQHLSH